MSSSDKDFDRPYTALRRLQRRRRTGADGLGSNRKNSPRRGCWRPQDVNSRERAYIIGSYLERLGTPRALTVWMLYKHGEHRQLVDLKFSPHHYLEASRQQLRKDYAATKFLSKCSDLATGIDTRSVAIENAQKAEEICRLTNARIKSLRSGAVMHPLTANWFAAKQIIARILGPVPESFPDVGWSSGRTTSAFGDNLSPIDKYQSRPDVTYRARNHALKMVNASPLWAASLLGADGPCSVLPGALNTVTGNVLTVVPKNAKTDRSICYEPHLNIRLQLAVGGHIRSRLRRVGVDLSDQSINQRRARAASKSGAMSTLDLAMASDTCALELVYELLPVDWAILLDDLRSSYTTWPDGSTRKGEKFSSMGNGFTFELESLIFYALMRTVSANVSVYGDDIIIATEDFEAAKAVLEFSGFSLNYAKSFSDGWFRESCGEDCYAGLSVTPPYCRRLPRDETDVMKLHNAVRAWCSRDPVPDHQFSLLLKSWRDIFSNPLTGPSGYGDGHFHVDLDESNASWDHHGCEGWWFTTSVRLFRVSKLGVDRVCGSFPESYWAAVLSAATGPKRARSVGDQLADRRQSVTVVQRVLASRNWPEILWTK